MSTPSTHPEHLDRDALLAHLEGLGIHCDRLDHPAVYTCEQADARVAGLAGARTKNLFLRDRKGRRHFLLTIHPEQVIDLVALGLRLDARGIGFASPQRLQRYLGVEPGAVSLLALVNDREHAVELVIDAALWSSPAFQCHPMVNTSTLVVQRQDLERLYADSGHEVLAIQLPERHAHDHSPR